MKNGLGFLAGFAFLVVICVATVWVMRLVGDGDLNFAALIVGIVVPNVLWFGGWFLFLWARDR